jgi:hypothetical protein
VVSRSDGIAQHDRISKLSHVKRYSSLDFPSHVCLDAVTQQLSDNYVAFQLVKFVLLLRMSTFHVHFRHRTALSCPLFTTLARFCHCSDSTGSYPVHWITCPDLA